MHSNLRCYHLLLRSDERNPDGRYLSYALNHEPDVVTPTFLVAKTIGRSLRALYEVNFALVDTQLDSVAHSILTAQDMLENRILALGYSPESTTNIFRHAFYNYAHHETQDWSEQSLPEFLCRNMIACVNKTIQELDKLTDPAMDNHVTESKKALEMLYDFAHDLVGTRRIKKKKLCLPTAHPPSPTNKEFPKWVQEIPAADYIQHNLSTRQVLEARLGKMWKVQEEIDHINALRANIEHDAQ